MGCSKGGVVLRREARGYLKEEVGECSGPVRKI